MSVKKEAMAPRTAGGLAGRMAHGGHIRRENYEFIDVKGPTPASALGRGPNFHPSDLDPVVHGGHTLRAALGGCIPEFTYPEGPVPSLTTGRCQFSRLGNQRPTAHNELTRGMASTGHTLLGNHVVIHTKRPSTRVHL